MKKPTVTKQMLGEAGGSHITAHLNGVSYNQALDDVLELFTEGKE